MEGMISAILTSIAVVVVLGMVIYDRFRSPKSDVTDEERKYMNTWH